METLGSHPGCTQLKFFLLLSNKTAPENFLDGTITAWSKGILRCSCWSKKADHAPGSPLCSSTPAAARLPNAMLAMAIWRNRGLQTSSSVLSEACRVPVSLGFCICSWVSSKKADSTTRPISSGRDLRHLIDYSSFVFLLCTSFRLEQSSYFLLIHIISFYSRALTLQMSFSFLYCQFISYPSGHK